MMTFRVQYSLDYKIAIRPSRPPSTGSVQTFGIFRHWGLKLCWGPLIVL